ncbi:histidine phosphatase family protein [Bacillus salacetis]|uniref:Histidine phosphatase family protein n=1 Tax=Bacillus salacetis TaxID=2315464 RepID=A0A3A1R7I6_9BACI|nr:histidine phosphatase family protein [Bacillus salacetis]RIW37293.1 histidine phosphatase family protein [Bacillus salacetis]
MKTNVYLVRHSHSIYTSDELGRPLSEKGFSDSAKITEILSKEKIDVFLSSPYLRAVQTIQGAAGHFGKEVELMEGFKERHLTSEPAEDFSLAIRKVWEDWHFSWEGGESNLAAQERGVSELMKVLEKQGGKNIAIGTHGNIMVLIMNHFDGRYDFSFWEQLKMPDVYCLSFDGSRFAGAKRMMD